MNEALTVIEHDNLVELENVIQKNLTAFYEVGFALMQIRDNRLYREIYGTFEEYCKEKWGMERRHAYRLIDGYKVSENVSDRTQKEYTLRPLTRIKDPDEQREVYQRAVEIAPDGKVTARHIEEVVNEIKHTETHVVSDAMTFAGIAISQLERIRQDDPKRQDALDKVARWVEIHKQGGKR
jgi:hypothetical protein